MVDIHNKNMGIGVIVCDSMGDVLATCNLQKVLLLTVVAESVVALRAIIFAKVLNHQLSQV